MTIKATQRRAFLVPVWQEISSLWSGVDLFFYDALQDGAGPLDPQLPSKRRFPNSSGNARLRTGARSSAG